MFLKGTMWINVEYAVPCCTLQRFLRFFYVLVFPTGQVRKVTYLGSSFHAAVIFDPEVRIADGKPMGS